MSSKQWQPRKSGFHPTDVTRLRPLPPPYHLNSEDSSTAPVGKDPAYDDRVSTTETTIDIQVGAGDVAKSFTLDKDLFYDNAGYFSDPRPSGNGNCVRLTQDDPTVFGLFVEWIKAQKQPLPYIPNHYSQEPWLSLSAHAWILGQKLQAHQFEAYALSQFVTNCALSELSTWELIEKQASSDSTIRRFSNHWIAWNCYVVGADTSEFGDFQASSLAQFVTEDTRDPRIYELDHWYSACSSDLSPSCSHDPMFKITQLEEATRVKKSIPDWGREWELNRKSSGNEQDSTSTNPVPSVKSRHPRLSQQLKATSRSRTATTATNGSNTTRPSTPPSRTSKTGSQTALKPFIMSTPPSQSTLQPGYTPPRKTSRSHRLTPARHTINDNGDGDEDDTNCNCCSKNCTKTGDDNRIVHNHVHLIFCRSRRQEIQRWLQNT